MKNPFKQLHRLCALAFVLTTFSCSNDDNVPAQAAPNDEITIQDFTVTIDENPTNGQSIGTIQAESEIALNFSITSQTPSGALGINSSSGELTITDTALFDFEINPVITADISVNNSTNSATASATINLSNVNELSAQDFSATIDENPIDGQVVGTMQANGSGTSSFSIASQTPVGGLNIDASTGELSVVDPHLFDYETNPVITATISVENAGEMATATATINLNDVDEVSIQQVTFAIDENPSNGAVVGTVQASSNSSVAYAISFQNPAGAFSIDANTGELTVADETVFDFETNPNMVATIAVENGVSTASANALVNLTDVNEIGEYKYGGVIFWIDPSSNNSAGLVCAVSDQAMNVSWGCQGTTLSGTSNALGTGAANTAAILAGCATSGIAADIATNTTIGNYSDWFLPSRAELHQMYLQRTIIDATALANGGTIFIADTTNRYWSSSESNGNTAWCKVFGNGTDQGLNKGAAAYFNVRVVRAWTDL